MTPEYAAYFVEKKKSFGLLSSMRAIVDPSAHLIFLTFLLTEYALYALSILLTKIRKYFRRSDF